MKRYLPVRTAMASAIFAIFMMSALRVAQVEASDQPPANQIMEGIDRVRNPDQPYRVTMALTEYVNGKARDRDGYPGSLVPEFHKRIALLFEVRRRSAPSP